MGNVDAIFYKFRGFEHGFGRKRRVFIDRKSDILFVAHLDTVKEPRIDKITEERITGAGFDDRLGCKIAHELSAELHCDLLLTDLEESGDSTAQWHTLKDYNWICEFDRAGNDVVTYGMENDRWVEELGKFWEVNMGMFSDISFMESKCCAMNLGIGYQHAHSDNSYYDPRVAKEQVMLFRRFFQKHKKNKFIMDEGKRDWLGGSRYNYSDDFYSNSDNYYESGNCSACGAWADETIYDTYVCESCIYKLVMGAKV